MNLSQCNNWRPEPPSFGADTAEIASIADAREAMRPPAVRPGLSRRRVLPRLYVLSLKRRLTLDVTARVTRIDRQSLKPGGRGVNHHSGAYVGIDTSKLRNAVA